MTGIKLFRGSTEYCGLHFCSLWDASASWQPSFSPGLISKYPTKPKGFHVHYSIQDVKLESIAEDPSTVADGELDPLTHAKAWKWWRAPNGNRSCLIWLLNVNIHVSGSAANSDGKHSYQWNSYHVYTLWFTIRLPLLYITIRLALAPVIACYLTHSTQWLPARLDSSNQIECLGSLHEQQMVIDR